MNDCGSTYPASCPTLLGMSVSVERGFCAVDRREMDSAKESFAATLFGVADKTIYPARTDGRVFPASAQGDVALVLSDAARAAGVRASANRPRLPARAHDGHHRRHGNRPARATAGGIAKTPRPDFRPDFRAAEFPRTRPAATFARRKVVAGKSRGWPGAAGDAFTGGFEISAGGSRDHHEWAGVGFAPVCGERGPPACGWRRRAANFVTTIYFRNE